MPRKAACAVHGSSREGEYLLNITAVATFGVRNPLCGSGRMASPIGLRRLRISPKIIFPMEESEGIGLSSNISFDLSQFLKVVSTIPFFR